MNRRIFKKITSHKYIYPTKRIQNIIRHIDESGDTIMYYKKNFYKYWLFILKRIEIKNKLFHKYFATRKYLMKVPKRDYYLGLDIVKKNMDDLYVTNYGVSCRISTPNYIVYVEN